MGRRRWWRHAERTHLGVAEAHQKRSPSRMCRNARPLSRSAVASRVACCARKLGRLTRTESSQRARRVTGAHLRASRSRRHRPSSWRLARPRTRPMPLAAALCRGQSTYQTLAKANEWSTTARTFVLLFLQLVDELEYIRRAVRLELCASAPPRPLRLGRPRRVQRTETLLVVRELFPHAIARPSASCASCAVVLHVGERVKVWVALERVERALSDLRASLASICEGLLAQGIRDALRGRRRREHG